MLAVSLRMTRRLHLQLIRAVGHISPLHHRLVVVNGPHRTFIIMTQSSPLSAPYVPPYVREGEEAPQSSGLVTHYQLNPVVRMLQQRIQHDTELLSRMMWLHQANTATSTFPGTEQLQHSYSYRATISGGEFVSDSQGSLVVTNQGRLQEAEEDIMDLSLEKKPSSQTGSPQFPVSPAIPDPENLIKTLSTKHPRPVFWNLLWALLRDQSFSSIVSWTDSKDLKFKIWDFQFLVDTWGKVKSKENMDVKNIVKVFHQIYTSIYVIYI